MLYLIDWSMEGQAIVEAKDEEEARGIFENSEQKEIETSSDSTIKIEIQPPTKIKSEQEINNIEYVLGLESNYSAPKKELLLKIKGGD